MGTRKIRRLLHPPRAPTQGPSASCCTNPPPIQSAALRERLVAEVPALKSPDEAANWAQRCLPAKNTLTEADAQIVETAFAARVATFDADELTKPQPGDNRENGAAEAQRNEGRRTRLVGKTIRLRDKEHRGFVTRQPCLVCGRCPRTPITCVSRSRAR